MDCAVVILLVLIQYYADIRLYISQIMSSFKVIQINMLSNLQIWKFASLVIVGMTE